MTVSPIQTSVSRASLTYSSVPYSEASLLERHPSSTCQEVTRQGITHQAIARSHITIVSDDLERAEMLQLELSCAGYQVNVIHDGLRGLLAIKRVMPDLVVIDWEPPRLSGVELCARLRANKGEESIILLAPHDSAEDRIAGLKAGADDCISVPFVKEEFLARVQASLSRRSQMKEQEAIVRCAGLILNRRTREVFRSADAAASAENHAIRLTAKEFDLLEYLMDHYFQVLTRSQILDAVWGYEFVGNSNIIEVYIRYLRRKLEVAKEPPIIHTVRSVGYILREPGV